MKKSIKIIFIIIAFLIGFILVDTMQAIIFKNSPFISWQENLADNDSWVDKGILIDTYYCTKEKDIITVSWKLKTTKITCPIDNENVTTEKELTKLDNISMTIKEGTLTKTSATIIITDLSVDENTYGAYYRIDKKENDKWTELQPIIDNYGFNSIGYLVDENNKLELHHKWDWLYGELESGEYRLVKEVNNKYFSVEFNID